MTTSRKHDMPARGGAGDPGAAPPAGDIDPELAEDLGPELDLRGDTLAAEVESARAEAAENLALAQRVQAEFDNFRKRMMRDQADAVARAGERIVEALLPVIDNLERAIDHTTAGGDLEDLLRGVELVHAQLIGVLGKEGVEVIDPFGKPFDPNVHQAVGTKDDAELPDHTVVEVYQKGYALAGRVVRPAMVVVSVGGPAT